MEIVLEWQCFCFALRKQVHRVGLLLFSEAIFVVICENGAQINLQANVGNIRR